MKALIHVVTALMLAYALIAPGYAQDGQVEAQKRATEQKQEQEWQNEQVYGWQLMTEQERNEHCQRMQTAQNKQDREKIRAEHHKEMQARAKEQGVTLPGKPQQRGQGGGQSDCAGGGARGGAGKQNKQGGKR